MNKEMKELKEKLKNMSSEEKEKRFNNFVNKINELNADNDNEIKLLKTNFEARMKKTLNNIPLVDKTLDDKFNIFTIIIDKARKDIVNQIDNVEFDNYVDYCIYSSLLRRLDRFDKSVKNMSDEYKIILYDKFTRFIETNEFKFRIVCDVLIKYYERELDIIKE